MLGVELVPAPERPDDCGPARCPVEAVEAEHVAEEVRDRALETVERASVSSRSETRTFTRSGRLTSSASDGLEAVRVAVVCEVLLRLIENHIDVALGLRVLDDVEQ